ncbi:MAG: NOL1/NOP2/sun family putative RNA methylase [Candidatus Nanoarchaeia archaeon]|nr:NOL1/NOP2/sun family putative RNA methylase [Candidatus Nanoarchaeia archaeon]
MKSAFKDSFLKRAEELMGKESKEYLSYVEKPLRKSIRVNTLKISPDDFIKRMKNWKLEKIRWTDCGYFVDEKGLGNTLEHFLGYFYVQGASSMIPPIVLNPEKNEIILDMCAAPGSKTGQMAAMMENTGLIVANDVRLDRIKAMSTNLQRIGAINLIITRNDGMAFHRRGITFDKVLLDAPCSGEGMFRKDYKVAKYWSEHLVKDSSSIQKSLILAGFDCLKENGQMVYSTCTLSPEEDEEVIDFLLRKRENSAVEKVKITGFKTRSGISEWRGKSYSDEVKKCARIYPQDNDTEAFFVSKVVKKA